jgi:glycosyltransferase involved in cell wall biosynthesis
MSGSTWQAMHKNDSPELVIQQLAPQRPSLRIAVVTETYPPEINGVALTLAKLVECLRARGHAIQLIRPRQPMEGSPAQAVFDQVLTRGIPIPRYPNLRLGLPSKRLLVSTWMQQRPDVVHIATEGPLGWSALRAATKLRLPVSSDFRTHFESYSQHYGVGWLRKPIESYLRKFHNQASCTLTPTESLRQSLVRARFERVHVVSRGVDTSRFSPDHRSQLLRDTWGVAPEQPVALYVGRLAPEKNLSLLIRAADATHVANPHLKWVIVGDGPARLDLQQALPHAHFAGPRSGTDLSAHYASADWFAFPSLTETYGNVVPEAMASGLAVLAFDRAAAAECIRNDHTGVLVPSEDEQQFLQLANRLATDTAWVKRLGGAACAAVQSNSWETIADQMESIWSGLLATPLT